MVIKRIIHCDWGTNALKRWLVRATFREECYCVSLPEPVGDLANFFTRIREGLDNDDRILVGFDFPIGLPVAYAEAAKIGYFPDALLEFGKNDWSKFFEKCRTSQEIGVHRPFYPVSCRNKGDATHAHLTQSLNLDWQQLLRQCDRETDVRGDACPLFWTLGPKQVGSGAIYGWRDLLAPVLRCPKHSVGLWPFGGNLNDSLEKYRTVVVETYPAEAYRHLDFPKGWNGKRDQNKRLAVNRHFHDWRKNRPVVFDQKVIDLIEDGFGAKPDGEDPFDALVGLCSMIDVALGIRADGAPDTSQVRNIEGWIFGQPASQEV